MLMSIKINLLSTKTDYLVIIIVMLEKVLKTNVLVIIVTGLHGIKHLIVD